MPGGSAWRPALSAVSSGDTSRPACCGQGGPRCTTAVEDRHMVRNALQDRLTSARQVAAQHQDASNQVISVSTVKRRLHEGNLHGRIPKKAPRLTPAHRAARRDYLQRRDMSPLLYACRHLPAGEGREEQFRQSGEIGRLLLHPGHENQEWRRVMFSDEVRFVLHKCDGRVKCWRPRGRQLAYYSVHESHITKILICITLYNLYITYIIPLNYPVLPPYYVPEYYLVLLIILVI